MHQPAEICEGTRVCVLQGRHFPTFSAGDAGVATRISVDAQTCDVLFDGRTATVPVSMHHLGMENAGCSNAAENNEAINGGSSQPGYQAECHMEPSMSSHGTTPSASRRLLGQAAMLETAQRAEVAELRRSLDDTMLMGREHEQRLRQQRQSLREAERQVEETERRAAGLQATVATLGQDLDRLVAETSNCSGSMEQKASALAKEVEHISEALVEQELRAVHIGDAMQNSRTGLVHLEAGVGQLSSSLDDLAPRCGG